MRRRWAWLCRLPGLLAMAGMLALLALLPRVVGAEALPARHGVAPGKAGMEFGFADPIFETVGDSESIPLGVVTALAQDVKGFIWIGTQRGLLRHDGYRFRKFTHDAGDAGSLADDYVQCLWAGLDGRLWVGMANNGLSVFDPGSERFENSNPQQKDGPGGGRVWALVGDATGGAWIGTDQGLSYRAADGKTFVRYRHDKADPGSLADDHVRSLLLDRQGVLWVGTGDGLQRFDRAGKRFVRVASDPTDPGSLAGQKVMALFEAADGKIWLGTRAQGAAWLTPGARQLHRVAGDSGQANGLGRDWIKSISQPRPDQIWIGTVGSGIHVVATDGHALQHLQHDPAIPTSLALDNIGALLTDHSGLLWAGTWGGGLQRHNPHSLAVRVVRHGAARPRGLSEASVKSVLELTDGRILAGTAGNGIDIFERQHGLVGGYRAEVGKALALADATILALAQTKDGTLWVGTQSVGVMRLLPGGNTWRDYASAQGLPHTQVSALLASRMGGLWVGTSQGLARWQADLQRFETFKISDGSPMQSPIFSLAEDLQGRLWAGTEAGLWVLEPGANVLQNIRHIPEQPVSLSSDRVTGLLVGSQGGLWVATPARLDRLRSWDGRHAEFEHVDIAALAGRAGLAGSNLFEDKLGRIWSESFVFDPVRMTATVIAKADGLDIGTVWVGSRAKTRDGLFLLGGTQGLAVIDPSQFQPWDFHPPVVATDFKINGKSRPPGGLAPALTLVPGQRNFSVEFAALDFTLPQKNRYRYRLQGEDSDWIDTDAEHRSATYGNLWPGRYLLEVRGSNRLGVWSDSPLQIPVTVLPAFWQTTWFFALIFLVLAGAVFGGYRWRLVLLRAKMQARALILQNMVDERTADIVKLGEIGQDLTATLDTEQAFERVYRQVDARLDAHVFCIAVLDTSQAQINMVYAVDDGQRQPALSYGIDAQDQPAALCIRERREIITNQRGSLPDCLATVSAAYLPLVVQERVIGCLSVQSQRVDAYGKDQIEFLRVLASYTAIAVSNSTAHGALASSLGALETAHHKLQETQDQLIQAEKSAAQAEKMAALGNLVVGVAHEINTPLGIGVTAASSLYDSAKLFADKYGRGQMKKRDLEEFVDESKIASEMILVNLERAAGLIQTFKKVSVEQSGEVKQRCNIKHELDAVLAGLRTRLAAAGIGTSLECAGDLEFDSYPDALGQIINYLLDNALLHAYAPGQGGAVKIAVRYQAPTLCISVADDGCGIPPEHLDRIYDPFFTTKRGGGNSGLGLHIVHNVVTQIFRGQIDCQSETGQGCRFVLSLQMD